jgi:ParB-like chromosome segregation protein Spo0J
VDYEHGLERLYDAFYGSDPIRLTKRLDGRYEVTGGYHRLLVARETGLEKIAASVAEETAPAAEDTP